MHRYLLLSLMGILLAACGPAPQDLAEAGVQQFHRLLAEERYAEIYAGASTEFREGASEQRVSRLLDGLRARLGAVRNSELAYVTVDRHSVGTFVTLRYDTDFALGPGDEQFVFRIEGDRARLVSYNVDSPVLIRDF
jgi:hypothetical protein